MSYPTSFDLSPAPAGNPQESNTEGKGHTVRKPFASVTNAVDNPLLLSLSPAGWEGVQSGCGPTTEAGHSQSTNNTDACAAVGSGGIDDANHGAHDDPSGPRAQALWAGLAAKGQTTGDAGKTSAGYANADGMSVSSMGTSDSKTGDSAYGTANDPYVDHEVSHIAPWVHDDLSSLGKE